MAGEALGKSTSRVAVERIERAGGWFDSGDGGRLMEAGSVERGEVGLCGGLAGDNGER